MMVGLLLDAIIVIVVFTTVVYYDIVRCDDIIMGYILILIERLFSTSKLDVA